MTKKRSEITEKTKQRRGMFFLLGLLLGWKVIPKLRFGTTVLLLAIFFMGGWVTNETYSFVNYTRSEARNELVIKNIKLTSKQKVLQKQLKNAKNRINEFYKAKECLNRYSWRHCREEYNF